MMKEKEELEQYRSGNFKIILGDGGVTVSDLSGGVSHSVSDDIAKGVFLRLMAKDEYEDWLEAYGAVMHLVVSTVPDMEFLNALQDAALSCVDRHKDLYGINPDISKEDDDLILAEQKEIAEELEELERIAKPTS